MSAKVYMFDLIVFTRNNCKKINTRKNWKEIFTSGESNPKKANNDEDC